MFNTTNQISRATSKPKKVPHYMKSNHLVKLRTGEVHPDHMKEHHAQKEKDKA
jgi:hypothetical protein